MRYFIRFLRMMLKLTHSPSAILPSQQLVWNDTDKENLTIFIESGTGKRFVKILKNIEAETNAQAIMSNKDISYNSGTAFGSRTMLAHVFAMSATDPQPNQEDEYELLRPETGFDELESILSQQMKR